MIHAFFQHKKRELRGVLHILKGKLTGNDEERLRGANEALNAIEKEREYYLREKQSVTSRLPDYENYVAPIHRTPEDKVARESNNRDISGY